MKPDDFQLKVTACLGFLAVALGAFGAHGMKAVWDALPDKADAAHRAEVWHTAVSYHLPHAVALLVVTLIDLEKRLLWTWRLWAGGIVLFSGSLYLFGYTGIKAFGAITPFGGLLFMAGWLALVVRLKKYAPKA